MSKEIPVIEVNKQAQDKTIQNRWWTVDEKDIASHLIPVVKAIESRQQYRRVQNLRHARLYSNQEMLGVQAGLFSQSSYTSLLSHRITLNVIKSCIDTAASKIAKAKPRPLFLTVDGDDSLSRRAKKLTQYMDGTFDEMDLYSIMQRGFVDAAIFGTGPTKFYTEGNKVKAERKIIDQLLVDDADGIYGKPQQMHEMAYISRDVLAEMFPKHEAKIMTASSGMPGDFQGNRDHNLIRVFESFHLPSGPEAKDGAKVIAIDGLTLDAEERKKNYFPYVFQRWNWKVTGWSGVGIAEELTGIQLEINKLLRSTQIAMHLMCVPRVFVENNSMFNAGALNNDIAAVYKYTGSAPIFNTAPAMPPEVYSHIENLYRKAFEIVGISQLSATSQKPAGLNSGIAMREYQDIESDRFQLVGQRYEDAFLDAARIITDLSKDLAAQGKSPTVKAKNGKAMLEIDWKDVELEDDRYVMRIFPTSILPTQPAGKLQTVQELTQAGFIDHETALGLLDFPDLEGFMSDATAAQDLTKKLICNMIERGEYQPPEPYEFLPQMKGAVQKAYLKGKLNDVPEDRLELLRRFMEDCAALIDEAAPPPPPQALGPMGGAPLAKPMPPSASDLLPNAPGGMPMPQGG